MDYLLIGFAGGLLVAGVSWTIWRLARRGRGKDKQSSATVSYESFITSMKAVGELNVFRIMTKEVITASDHWFGDFGKKYLNWLLSSKRITLVIEFDVNFRYDLTDPAFGIDRLGDTAFQITMPPCKHEVLIRNMRIHSEDKTELLPWLMPDLLGRFFTGGFSVEAKNKLIAETRDQAIRFAGDLVDQATVEAQRSAVNTLTMLAQGLGAWRVDFDFTTGGEFHPHVDTSRLENILPDPEGANGQNHGS
ncbi:MAG: DUF4230 domain-containing protein [Gemmatimonadales bacterium]|nr:DUF4230 domain-containing protein [Gemmatimonadales bacterium]